MVNVLQQIGTFSSSSGAEIVAYDDVRQALFVVSGNNTLEILDLSNPQSITPLFNPINLASLTSLPIGGANSVAYKNNILAIAAEATTATDPGYVALIDLNILTVNPSGAVRVVQVGAQPDMVTFSPDGTRVLVANEGEPNDLYTIDPEGSISIINIASGINTATVTTAGFQAFNPQLNALREAGVRIFGPGALSVSTNLEPEYIAVSADSSTAYVTLQEANALAVVDIASSTVTNILPLGFKNHSLPGNGLDASDRDNAINIRNWPIFGMYQPDAIAAYTANGQTYLVTANEGDARIRPDGDFTDGLGNVIEEGDVFNEETRIKDVVLDPTAFPNAAELQLDANLGRLLITNTLGDTDGDGDFDELYAYGGRSFSIWDSAGDLVFDSGDMFAQITAQQIPQYFNSQSNSTDEFDSRSDNKGSEPEALAIGTIGSRTYAFIGLERVGGIMVYDITDPVAPTFVQYLDYINNAPGHISPEGMVFIPAANSPNGQNLLVVANEVSRTVGVFSVDVSGTLPGPIASPLIDLSDITGNVGTSFVLNREAAFDNFVGFYAVTGADLGIDVNGDGVADFLPGAAGYTQAAIDNRVDNLVLTTDNLVTSQFQATLAGGAVYAPFLIAQGTPDSYDPAQVFFASVAANVDGVEHIRFANNQILFEDLYGGGDNDFDDAVIDVAFV